MPSLDRAAILLLSGTLALINVGCSQVNSLWSFNEQPEPVASLSPSTADEPADDPEPVPTPISQPPLSAKTLMNEGLTLPTVLPAWVSLPSPLRIGS
jgi:hypothetical protein